MKNRITLLLAFAVVAVGLAASGASGAEPPHPYHVSLAEVNWNAKSQKFEVALCLWPADLEKALARQTGRPIDLEKESNIDRLMETYIAKRFTIHSTNEQSEKPERKLSTSVIERVAREVANTVATKTRKSIVAPPTPITIMKTASQGGAPTGPPKMKWHGHEADAKQVWLYFEIVGDSRAAWTVENRVFFELNDDQLNHVQWNGTGKTETLVCNAGNARIVLPKK